MFSDVHVALGSIKVLIHDFSSKSLENKIQSCSSMMLIVNELEKNLDRKWEYHSFTFNKLDEIREAAQDLWVAACIDGSPNGDPNEILERIQLLVGELASPVRWPSSCVLHSKDGRVLAGRNDPHPELFKSAAL